MTVFYDHAGHPVSLDAELGRGGEGAVFAVAGHPQFVAKVYHAAVEPERVAKFRAMARLATGDLLKVAAWPVGTLHRTPGGPLAGLVMPAVIGHREIHELYSPAQRRQHFPKADWAFLVHVAMNCAAAFEVVHAAGHAIGDVNQSGVLVHPRGTVHLIDCDSFQVVDGPTVYPCVVGVPQYTPPELQGVNFRDVRRTADHDNFGLALVVFHLLFMGRHPFAGRFGGAGDMPIEKAISTGRFAFGRHGPARQMLPPPNALPLAAVPGPVADLFERAFAFPPAGPRPAAGQWRAALAGLKTALRPCAVDRGHQYAGASCAWCDLARTGGPDFFASAANDDEPPYVNVAGCWQQVEAVSVPPKVIPPYHKPHLVVAEPLPESLADVLLFRRVFTWVSWGGLATLGIGLAVSVVVAVIGACVMLLAMTVTAVLALMPGVRRERWRRRDRLTAAEESLKAIAGQWTAAVGDTARKFDRVKDDLAAARTPAARVHVECQQELARLDSAAREHQLREFLDRFLIRDHNIPNIGPARTNTLAMFGIETAADVTPAALEGIPGIADQCTNALLGWRERMATGFRFDPRQGVPPAQRRAVRQRYLRLKHQYEHQFQSGVATLRELSATAVQRVQTLLPHADHWQREVLQARADLKQI